MIIGEQFIMKSIRCYYLKLFRTSAIPPILALPMFPTLPKNPFPTIYKK